MTRSLELLGDAPRDESAVPSSADILARLPGQIRRRRRRMRAAWSAGAAVMAILVAASVMLGLRLPHQSAARWPLHAPSVVEVSRLGTTVNVAELTPGHLTAYVFAPGVSATLFASAPSATPADQLAAWRAHGKAVTVNGREGFYVVGRSYTSVAGLFPRGSEPTAQVPTLAWQYAPDSWAFLTGCNKPALGYSDPRPVCPNPENTLLRTAKLVKFGSPAMITAPVQFGYLPNDWHLTRFDRLGVDGSGLFGGSPDDPCQIYLSFTDGGPSNLQVTITPANGTDWHDGWDEQFRPTGTIDGHPVIWSGDGPESGRTVAWVDFGSCHVQVGGGDHDVTTRIVKGLTVANCLDNTTWWDVRKINVPDDLPPHSEMPYPVAS